MVITQHAPAALQGVPVQVTGRPHLTKLAEVSSGGRRRWTAAVDGGGRTTDTIHSDTTSVGAWEEFTVTCGR